MKSCLSPQTSAASNPWEVEAAEGYDADIDNETTPLYSRNGGDQKASMEKEREQSTLDCLRSLKEAFGYQLLVFLFFVQPVLKGFVNSWVKHANTFLFDLYNIQGPKMQIYASVIHLPWALQPLMGLISDFFPIFGYTKAPHMIAVSLLGAIAFFLVGTLPTSILPIWACIILLFMGSLQISTCDLLADARYALEIKAKPKVGPDLMSFVWLGLTLFGICSVLGSGLVQQGFGVKIMYVIAAIPALAVLIPLFNGYVQEKKLTAEEVSLRRKFILQQKETVLLCGIMAVCALSMSVCGVIKGVAFSFWWSLVCGIIVLISYSLLLSPRLAKIFTYVLIQAAVGFNISGSRYYFMTDSPKAYPDGPHFSKFFATSIFGIAHMLFSLFGIYLYRRYLRDWSFRNVIVAANLTYVFFGAMDIVFYKRMNESIGIPDWVFVLGTHSFEGVLHEFCHMPTIVIISHMCPKGMEAIVFALLAGSMNLGIAISSSNGAYLLHSVGCTPNGKDNEGSKFNNFWVAAVASIICPLLVSILGSLTDLIPNVKQTESLGVGTVATTGSL